MPPAAFHYKDPASSHPSSDPSLASHQNALRSSDDSCCQQSPAQCPNNTAEQKTEQLPDLAASDKSDAFHDLPQVS